MLAGTIDVLASVRDACTAATARRAAVPMLASRSLGMVSSLI
jgi:hypothetical protein